MAKKTAAEKPLSKTQLISNIAEATGLTKKEVDAVLEAFKGEVAKAVATSGPGQIQLPGLLKIVKQHRPATKKKQVRNPATGEMVWSGPKPARDVIKVRPLKALKDMV
jgi:nucleoid DNA-binding protein